MSTSTIEGAEVSTVDEHTDPAYHLAHHFDSADQQFESGKMGIWLFLATEILFFSGLFCAYAIFRSNHPEIFIYASKYLDTFWGATNTVVLLFSSLTAAWAVRNAQLGQQKMLVVNILLTILCAFGFMGIKYVEYEHKFHIGLLTGDAHTFGSEMVPGQEEIVIEEMGASGMEEIRESRPANAHLFFAIYYGMTGLHGIHVVLGIIVWLWILKRALRREFGPKFYGPVDFTALYWHIVDIVWIYLFPMLYLIH